MTDNQMPTLTLEPSAQAETGIADLSSASIAAPAAPSIGLTLDAGQGAQQTATQDERDKNAVKIDESMLTEEEKKVVADFAKQIDIKDSNQVMAYGSAAQKHIANFSESALKNVKTQDLGTIGDVLSSLVVQLRTMDEPQKKGIAGWFQRRKRDIEELKATYAKAEVNVDKIVDKLEEHEVVLMTDIATFDQMYDLNLKYYKELTMYIIAGKKKLEEVRAGELEELKAKAKETGTQEDAQKYNDLANLCERFDKIQLGPQTRLLQNNDTLMVEKIQSSIVNTIPLWKSQMVLALGIEHGRQATAAQAAVTEMTNDLLKRNSEALKMATIDTAKEAERSIVDIETLKLTNENLINTLDEVMRIQNEGRQKRKEAEAELGRIEGELRQKLLELRG